MPQRELQAPDGTIGEFDDNADPAVIKAWVVKHSAPPKETPAPLRPVSSHQPRPEEILGASDPDYIGGNPAALRDTIKANAPMVGATAALLHAPEMGLINLIARPAFAFGGGYLGAKAGGSDDPVFEGGLQALTETLGMPQQASRSAGKATMGSLVPERVAKDFHNIDVPQQLLDRGFFPGWGGSATRAANETTAATAERLAAAHTAPPISPFGVVTNHRDLYQQAIRAAEPKRARDVATAAAQTVGDVRRQYPRGMPGEAQVARKDIKYDEGMAAVRGSDALAPNLKKAEADALAANLRQSPRMASALDNSQQLMAINQVHDKAARDTFLKRLKGSGVVSAVTGSPKFNSVAAHVMNQGSRVFDPNTARLLTALLRQRSNTEEPE